jgi:peroxiredoxin
MSASSSRATATSAPPEKVFAQHRSLHVPLLADFHPKGEVAKRYGVYDEGSEDPSSKRQDGA